jgi:hypothetical protein
MKITFTNSCTDVLSQVELVLIGLEIQGRNVTALGWPKFKSVEVSVCDKLFFFEVKNIYFGANEQS